jgi:hypothetical protein
MRWHVTPRLSFVPEYEMTLGVEEGRRKKEEVYI